MGQSIDAAVEGLVSRPAKAELDVEFEERLADSGPLAFRIAYGVLRHREDAEDVAQEALARAYQSFARLRDRGRFRSWLVRICWRLALDHQRSSARRARREHEASAPPTPVDVEAVAYASEFRVRLWRAMEKLPEKQRQVMVLAGILGHDLKEVVSIDHRVLRGADPRLEQPPSFDRIVDKAGRKT